MPLTIKQAYSAYVNAERGTKNEELARKIWVNLADTEAYIFTRNDTPENIVSALNRMNAAPHESVAYYTYRSLVRKINPHAA